MGDRCSVTVTVLSRDRTRFEEAVGKSPVFEDPAGPGLTDLTFDDCNYALESQLEEAAQAGLRFWGHHGPGASYPPGVFVSDGTRMHYAVSSECSSQKLPVLPVCLTTQGRITIAPTGNVGDEVRRYLQVRLEVESALRLEGLDDAQTK